MPETIGILGASGFVGSALCERLHFEGHRNFVPFVRSTGNAWRLTRFGMPVKQVDLLDKPGLRAALDGCDVVVNCALGDDTSRTLGFDNLVRALKGSRVTRFVHLSSIAIYGQDPPEDSATEQGKPVPSDAYGQLKLRQDQQVLALRIPSIILCPGNITGPYSFFAQGLVERLARGPMPLVDGGRNPSNLIHVDNLVEAILASVRTPGGFGERYFVNEQSPVPWRQLFGDLAERLGFEVSYIEVARADVMPFVVPPRRSMMSANLSVAMSGEFRRAVSMLPALGAVNRSASDLFKRLPPSTQQRVRERLRWPVRVRQVDTRPALNNRYVTVQTRRAFHSPARLRQLVGWQPPLTYSQGLDTLVAWLRFAGVPRRH